MVLTKKLVLGFVARRNAARNYPLAVNTGTPRHGIRRLLFYGKYDGRHLKIGPRRSCSAITFHSALSLFSQRLCGGFHPGRSLIF